MLGHWDFLRSVFRSGHAAIMVEALGAAADSISDYSADALRYGLWCEYVTYFFLPGNFRTIKCSLAQVDEALLYRIRVQP